MSKSAFRMLAASTKLLPSARGRDRGKTCLNSPLHSYHSLWLSVVLSVREAHWPWQSGRGRDKGMKSRFGICLDLWRLSQAPAAGWVTPFWAEV